MRGENHSRSSSISSIRQLYGGLILLNANADRDWLLYKILKPVKKKGIRGNKEVRTREIRKESASSCSYEAIY